MRIALSIIAVIVVTCAAVVLSGWLLPVKHHVSRDAAFTVPVHEVYMLVSGVEHYPDWRTTGKSVEVLPPVDGRPRFRETGGDGSILYEITESRDDVQRVTRIADPSLPFGGTWTYDFRPTATGSALRITEDGEVYNPLFRFMSKYVFSHTRTMDVYLRDMSQHFGAAQRTS